MGEINVGLLRNNWTVRLQNLGLQLAAARAADAVGSVEDIEYQMEQITAAMGSLGKGGAGIHPTYVPAYPPYKQIVH